jgi:hypothetical protein
MGLMKLSIEAADMSSSPGDGRDLVVQISDDGGGWFDFKVDDRGANKELVQFSLARKDLMRAMALATAIQATDES